MRILSPRTIRTAGHRYLSAAEACPGRADYCRSDIDQEASPAAAEADRRYVGYGKVPGGNRFEAEKMRRAMRKTITQEEKLQARIDELESRLAEAEETIRAIHQGEVDALVIETATGTQISP